MLAVQLRPRQDAIHYPESDGKPMADNTVQYELMVMIKGGIDALIPDFVAGNLFWYPVEGAPQIVQAPDVMVALGRPKGDRGSYRQWEEGGIAPQVAFEILSPCNTLAEMQRKLLFYQKYGVEEYYILDPELKVWLGYQREGAELKELVEPDEWTSPLLGIRFGVADGVPALWRPDGRRFRTFQELATAEEAAVARADQEQTRADQEHARADQEHARAEQEAARAERERARVEELTLRLRALGVEV